ncbi:MAG TPA: group III truncated hemoglobin [Sulfurimonas sp.]|nr:group III truncated hemoglobin [Sulfurimonas sp.]
MTLFYEKALEDKVLGPFFVHELGDDMQDEEWLHHIDLLADFWLAQLNGEDTYYGNFIGAHVKMPVITPESFVSWIKLFSEAADEIYTPEIAIRFKKRGSELSKEFMQALKLKGQEWIQFKKKISSS